MKLAPVFCGGFAVFVGVLVMAGLVFDVAVLKSMLSWLVAVKVNTALSFVLAGAALGIVVYATSVIHRDFSLRRQAEKALRVTEENLAATLRSIGDAVLATDTEGRVAWLNDAAEQLTGWTEGEAKGRRVEEVFHIINEETRRPAPIPVDEVPATGVVKGRANHTVLITRQGAERPISDSVAPIRRADGLLLGLVLVFRDVTEERRAQQALEQLNADLERRVRERTARLAESEERFRGVVNSAMDAIVSVDEEQRILLFNPAAERMFGHPASEMIGQPLERLIPQRLRRAHANHFGNFAATGLSNRAGDGLATVSGLRAGGMEFPVELSISRTGAAGRGIFTAILRDVTERKAREEQLRKLSRCVEQSPAYIVITDPTGSIEYVNPKFTEITGYSLAEVLGKTPRILKSGHTQPEVYERLWQAVTAGKEWRGEILNRKKNGELFWGRASISPIVDEAGCVTHFLAANEDITERRRAERALRLLNEELMRSNNELEQFAYVASHDLQEPLRMVASYTGLLAERYAGKLDEKADKFIGYAVEGARRMQELINDLLALSRVNTRGEPFEIVACADVVAEVRQNLAKAIEESGAEICVGALPVVLAARTQLAQLFQNLIGNAIKFRGDGSPRVEISAARDGANWVFAVKDNGIGIAPEFHERVFVIFQRLHDRQKYSGSGIGLAIAKKIVERHQGRIWVESEVGAGTHFFFSIPCSTNERKVIDERQNRDSDGGGQSGGCGLGKGKTCRQQVPA